MLSVSVSLSRRMQAQNVYFCHFVSFCQIARYLSNSGCILLILCIYGRSCTVEENIKFE